MLPGLTPGEPVHQRDAQSWGNPSLASMLGSQAGVALERAAPGELLLYPGTHKAFGSFAAAWSFFSQAVLLAAEVLQVCAYPFLLCVAEG